MYYIMKGHDMVDEIVSICLMFYPNEKFTQLENADEKELTVASIIEDNKCRCDIYKAGEIVSRAEEEIKSDDIREIKRYIKLSIFKAVKKIMEIEMPWGILTGIRPAKRVMDMWAEGFCDDDIIKDMEEKFLVREDKARLSLNVAKTEKKILSENDMNKIGIYVGIPFCPTRCLYCSFTSYPIKNYEKKVDIYLDCLEKEMRYTFERLKDKDVESIYIGGGTPTSLNEEQFERLLEMIGKYIKKPTKEYCAEAGRADTITREKLKVMKKYGVSRISVNPQTMNDKTLETIGREHSVGDFISAFEMARQEGHYNINTDIILGLPGEKSDDVKHTMEEIIKLSPESITVHTLAVKRASRLREKLDEYYLIQAKEMEKMLDIAAKYCYNADMHPYYMYRQKNMIGNFENVGYCKDGYESVYNVQIMEEKQCIAAVGAGGSTKWYEGRGNRIERVFNVKSVDDYINRIDEMIERKDVFFDGR